MIYFYVYVNANDLNVDMRFIPRNCKGTFIDSANHNTGFETLMETCHPGDIIRTPSVSKLGKDAKDTFRKIKVLSEKHITLETADFGLINTSAANYLFSQFQYIQKRDAEPGHAGRPKKAKPENYQDVLSSYFRKEINSSDAAAELGVARSTFMRWVKEETKCTE